MPPRRRCARAETILDPSSISSGCRIGGQARAPSLRPKGIARCTVSSRNRRTTVLYVGAENWPVSVPLSRRATGRRFDTGKRQRRVQLAKGRTRRGHGGSRLQDIGTTPRHTSGSNGDRSDPVYAKLPARLRRCRRRPEEPSHGYYFRFVRTGPARKPTTASRDLTGRQEDTQLAVLALKNPRQYRSSES
jgi:hypothetical protein